MSYGWNPESPANRTQGWNKPLEKRLRVNFAGEKIWTSFDSLPDVGALWVLDEFDGWWEPAPNTTKREDAPGGYGTISMSPRLGGRSLTLETRVFTNLGRGFDADELLERISRLSRGLLVVEEPYAELVREIDVSLESVRTFIQRRPVPYANATLSLQADDPLRYGVAVQSLTNGRNVLLNPGDARCWPVLDLVGPHSAITITHPGGMFTFPALSSGQQRTVDGRNGDVWDGESRVFVGSGPWPRVDVGGAEWQISGLGSGSAKVRRFQAWT